MMKNEIPNTCEKGRKKKGARKEGNNEKRERNRNNRWVKFIYRTV